MIFIYIKKRSVKYQIKWSISAGYNQHKDILFAFLVSLIIEDIERNSDFFGSTENEMWQNL